MACQRRWITTTSYGKALSRPAPPLRACYHDLAEKRSTGVIEFLRQNGVDLVLVGGLALDYCVKTTAPQLRRAGFEVIVFLPACRAIASETVESACIAMREQGITLATSLEQLDGTLAKENLR